MTLETIVKELLIEQGESNLNKFARYLQFGISGLREFAMDTAGVPKIVSLPVNANGTVDLPFDYIAYRRIAICGVDGNLHSLSHNPLMCINVDFDNCGNIESNSGGGVTYLYDAGNHVRNGQNTGGYFGAKFANPLGNYRIDEKNNYIVLQNYSGDTLVLEYLADIERNEEGKFIVHPYLTEAIKAYIQWKGTQRNVKAQLGVRDMNLKDYEREKRKAERRFASFTIDEFRDIIGKNNQLTPKF